MDKRLTVPEIVELITDPKRYETKKRRDAETKKIRRRLDREKINYDEENGRGRGGKIRYYSIKNLPSDIQTAYYNKVYQNALAANRNNLPARYAPPGVPATPTPRVRNFYDPCVNSQPISGEVHIYPGQNKKLEAKLALLTYFAAHRKKALWGEKVHFETDFLIGYNSGQVWPHLYQILGPIKSVKTIKGWAYKLRNNGGNVTSLADNRGYSRKGQRSITQDQAAILFACAISLVTPYKSEIIRVAKHAMRMRGMATGPSDDTCRRLLNQWVELNYDKYVLIRYGEKGLDDYCLPYVQRDLNKIKVGDLVTADGHVLNFEIINPWTGKPKRMTLFGWYDMASNFPLGWDIMPTESTQVIYSSLRKALITAGMFFKAALLDNGGAISSKFFNGKKLDNEEITGLFARLGIPTIFAWPYHPQSKPIEGFFETLGEFERLTPSYVGTSIETKPPHLRRGEKMLRKIHERLTRGSYPTLEQAHRFIAASFDEYVRRPQKDGHLNGKCPLEVFEAGKGPGIDPIHLRFLMMTEVVRTIRRNGIQFLGRDRWYYSPKLYGRKHQVRIRYDLQDQDSILVYDMDDQFICEAFRRDKVHPAASILGTDADVDRLRDQLSEKARLKKQTVSRFKEFAESTLIPETRKRLEAQGLSIDNQKPEPKKLPEKLSEIDTEKIMAEVEELKAMNQDMHQEVVEDDYQPESVNPDDALRYRLEKMNEVDRYEALLEREITGERVPQEWAFFMRRFEMGAEYQRHKDYFEDRRAIMAVLG